MKIIAISAYLAIASASASASPFQQFQLGQRQRLRGNQDTRELEECDLERSSVVTCMGATTGQAYKPTSTHPDFSIDGSLVPWEADSDLTCGIPMYEAGTPGKALASYAFLNWDCNTGELCILVKTTDETYLDEDEDDENMWLKVEPKNSNESPLGDGGVRKIRDDENRIIAWEACYSMAADCLNSVRIHANYYNITDGAGGGRTTSTGKKANGDADTTIALDLYCPCEDDADCKIDECYAPSKCSTVDGIDPNNSAGTVGVGVCEYAVVEDQSNCCVNDDGCDDALTCVIGDSSVTGTCQVISSTPSPSTTVPPGPTSPSPTGEGAPTPTNQCSSDNDCSVGDLGHPQCAVAKCNNNTQHGNTCGVEPINMGDPCDNDKAKENGSEYGNTCYQPICDGVNCVDDYKKVDSYCDPPADADMDCNNYKCKAAGSGRTTCEHVSKPEGTDCNTARDSLGLCDIGDKCDGAGNCSTELSYKANTEVCRPSKADIGQPCDAPEYCTGSNHTCPEDKNYGDEQVLGAEGSPLTGAYVCRSSGRCDSGDCVDDVAEVCPGGTSECPPDIIFQREFEIIAAQHNTAGSTTITVTDHGSKSVQVCVTIALNDDWELQPGSDHPIKYDATTEAEPKPSPGSYGKKYATLQDQADDSCFIIETNYESCTMYFALHLDVQSAVDGDATSTETAWAKLATDDETADLASTLTQTETSLQEQPFKVPGTKKGPRVILSSTSTETGGGASVGWGNYYSFSICCATVDMAAICPITVGGGGDGTGSNETSTTYTCTGDDGSTSLTCQHDADKGEDVGCHTLASSLFG